MSLIHFDTFKLYTDTPKAYSYIQQFTGGGIKSYVSKLVGPKISSFAEADSI